MKLIVSGASPADFESLKNLSPSKNGKFWHSSSPQESFFFLRIQTDKRFWVIAFWFKAKFAMIRSSTRCDHKSKTSWDHREFQLWPFVVVNSRDFHPFVSVDAYSHVTHNWSLFLSNIATWKMQNRKKWQRERERRRNETVSAMQRAMHNNPLHSPRSEIIRRWKKREENGKLWCSFRVPNGWHLCTASEQKAGNFARIKDCAKRKWMAKDSSEHDFCCWPHDFNKFIQRMFNCCALA